MVANFGVVMPYDKDFLRRKFFWNLPVVPTLLQMAKLNSLSVPFPVKYNYYCMLRVSMYPSGVSQLCTLRSCGQSTTQK
jgi:hypothetical protein